VAPFRKGFPNRPLSLRSSVSGGTARRIPVCHHDIVRARTRYIGARPPWVFTGSTRETNRGNFRREDFWS
jgi:hypothetical protein